MVFLPKSIFQKDLEYWQIDELILEPCCALKYYPEIELCVKEQKGEQEAKAKESQRLADENFGNSKWGKIRTLLWNVMEYPETSRTAQVSHTSTIHILFKMERGRGGIDGTCIYKSLL